MHRELVPSAKHSTQSTFFELAECLSGGCDFMCAAYIQIEDIAFWNIHRFDFGFLRLPI